MEIKLVEIKNKRGLIEVFYLIYSVSSHYYDSVRENKKKKKAASSGKDIG